MTTASVRTKGLTDKAAKHYMSPLVEVGGKLDVILIRGEGCYVWDTNGRYL